MKLLIQMAQQANGSYRACCPALPGCVVYGQSRAEAQSNIDQAVKGYLASLDVALPRRLDRESVIDAAYERA